jgi:hypothetical protein
MLSRLEPEWILYAVALLVALVLIRALIRWRNRPSRGVAAPRWVNPPGGSGIRSGSRRAPDPAWQQLLARLEAMDEEKKLRHEPSRAPSQARAHFPATGDRADSRRPHAIQTDPPLAEAPAALRREPGAIAIPSVFDGNRTTVAPASIASTPREEHASLQSLGADSTIQLLPGRLEVVSGPNAGLTIPFVRFPGREVQEFTLGRSEGSHYDHVQVADQTVSRVHARLRLEADRWVIVNLSRTNPVRVNGRELAMEEEAVALAHGDSIHLGAVELRYRDGGAS